MAWLGVAADVASLVIPCVAAGGALVRAATKADEAVDTLKAVGNVGEAVDTAKKGWHVGDDITNLTKAGNTPKWSTVQSRYWKNEAFYNPSNYSATNLSRMQKGRAPMVKYTNGQYYSMELHHKIPRHKGGTDCYSNLLPVAPWEHAAIDPYRHFKP